MENSGRQVSFSIRLAVFQGSGAAHMNIPAAVLESK